MHAINLEENSVFASEHHVCMVGPATGHSVKTIAMCESAKIAAEMATALNANAALAKALAFYTAICGNTCAMVGRESAQMAHDMATVALEKANKAE